LRKRLLGLRELLGKVRRGVVAKLAMAARTAPAASAGAAVIVGTMFELQWTISLVESRTPRKRNNRARLPEFVGA